MRTIAFLNKVSTFLVIACSTNSDINSHCKKNKVFH